MTYEILIQNEITLLENLIEFLQKQAMEALAANKVKTFSYYLKTIIYLRDQVTTHQNNLQDYQKFQNLIKR